MSESGGRNAEKFLVPTGEREFPVGAHVPPPHEDIVHGEDMVHGTRPEEVVEFDVLSDGESDSLENGGLDDENPIKNSFEIDGDVNDFTWLEPAESNVEVKKVQHFMAWFKAGVMGSPEVRIEDTEGQVKTGAVGAIKKALVYRRIRVVNLPLSHHKCKRMMKHGWPLRCL